MEKSQVIPLRWMAPETLRLSNKIKFSVASDVWSFGITLWKIYTLGELPYFQFNNNDVRQNILSGVKPKIPARCPDIIKEIITKCWNFNPEGRCSFDEVVSIMNENESYEDQIPLLATCEIP